MISFMEMENRNFRGHPSRFDQRGIFQCASGAETDGADIPAPIAFDAFPKLPHPILEALLLRKAFYLFNI
jgi:hypothetical protein